jgi:hypothetical protein
MRILRPIVQAFVLAMLHLKAHLRPCRAIGAELAGDHHAGPGNGRFQKLLHKPLCRVGVSAALDQNVENEAILINGAPEPVLFARDRDDNLVHMPFVAASGGAFPEPIGERLAELLSPLANGFVRHANPAPRRHLFHHAKAQGRPEIKPNGIADDFRREAMAAIERITDCRHDPRYSNLPSQFVKLTVPPQLFASEIREAFRALRRQG